MKALASVGRLGEPDHHQLPGGDHEEPLFAQPGGHPDIEGLPVLVAKRRGLRGPTPQPTHQAGPTSLGRWLTIGDTVGRFQPPGQTVLGIGPAGFEALGQQVGAEQFAGFDSRFDHASAVENELPEVAPFEGGQNHAPGEVGMPLSVATDAERSDLERFEQPVLKVGKSGFVGSLRLGEFPLEQFAEGVEVAGAVIKAGARVVPGGKFEGDGVEVFGAGGVRGKPEAFGALGGSFAQDPAGTGPAAKFAIARFEAGREREQVADGDL